MRKKYTKPKLTVEAMNLPLLVDTSNIHVGGTGSFDAKEWEAQARLMQKKLLLVLTMKKIMNNAIRL